MFNYKCRVEYLESTGTQYIDTGYAINTATDEIEINFQIISTTVYQWLMGEHDNGARFGIGVGDGTNKRNIAYGSNTYKVNDTQVYNNRHTLIANSNGIYLDGTQVHGFESFSSTSTIYLFALNLSGASKASGKIWNYKHKRNGALIRDFIPVLDDSGRPAMYDQVSSQLFYNQGTGEFNYGRQIIPVEYLESSDTQYIDTGVVARSNITVSCDWMFLDYTSSERSCAIAAAIGSGNTRIVAAYAYNGQFRFAYGTNTHVGTCEANTRYKTVAVLNQGEQSFSVNGTTLYTGTSSASISANRNLTLFEYAGTSSYVGSFARIYSCSIIQDGVLVRDFIPAIDENGVGFMFDNVSNTIYDNAGTGKFGYNKRSATRSMLRKKLALMLATLKKPRPFYCEIEYLENTAVSSARNWISTGIVPDTTTRWEVRVAFNNTTTGKLMGSGYANPTRFNLGIESNKFRFAFNAWFDANSNITTPDTNAHTWTMDASSKTFTIDGYSTTTSQNFGTSTFPICLFGRCNSASGVTETSNAVVGKIYYSKIWQNGVLVRDMIPVLDWNYVPCMYDKVSGELFYNQGTGNFSYGREIHLVEYLESTGTQYADLGIYGNLNTEIEVKAYIDEHTTHFALAGDFTDSTRAITLPVNYGSSGLYSRFGNKVITTGLGSPEGTYKFVMNKTGYYRDDVLLGSFNTTTSFTTSNTLMICGFTNLGRNYFEGKIYYCKVRNNGTLVGDFIPAIDENGVGYMFDRVSHTIHDNIGTDAFKYPARELEYIQSTGTQYLNTGWNPGANAGKFTFDIEVQCTANTTGHGSIGSRSVDAGRNWVITNVTQTPTNQTVSQYGYGNTYKNVTSDTSNKWARMRTYIDGSNYVLETTVDNVTSIETIPVQTFTNTANVYLLGINNKGTLFSSFPFIGKMRRARLYDNGTLVKDYRPAFKSGYFGFWDSVNDYLPAITGNVTHGKIKEPEYE